MAETSLSGREAPTNRLAYEKSPYLLQHCRNPVDWYPWGDEAFQKARNEDKLIFLSVGYSTCHWCHVMERESFEKEETAEVLNRLFVNVKVDKEERPDVDRMYMMFIQAATGSGGWPMNLWLTPDLCPITGGTYFPPKSQYGQRAFVDVCRRVADLWAIHREDVTRQSGGVLKSLASHTSGETDTLSSFSVIETEGHNYLARGYRSFVAVFDENNGGFSRHPKFPRPVALNFLLRIYERFQEEGKIALSQRALEMVVRTLNKMRDGGIYDHLGGGFHRYAVDASWHVPHFEKMLYDQAQLIVAYLDAFAVTKDPKFEHTAREVLDYVIRDLSDPAGGIRSAEDADSQLDDGHAEKGEGAFYTWARDEIVHILGQEKATLVCTLYGVESHGNVSAANDPHEEFRGKNIMAQCMTIDEAACKVEISPAQAQAILEEARKMLYAAREKRPRPHMDDKVITAWNGLFLSALAKGFQLLRDPKYLDVARNVVAFHRTVMYVPDDEGKRVLLRSYRQGPSSIKGFLDDYAFLVQGLLDLYEACGDEDLLVWAAELQRRQDELFYDSEHGAYFTTTPQDPTILIRMKDEYDGAEPSSNSISALNLRRLATLLNSSDWQHMAEKTVGHYASRLEAIPEALPQMLCAVDSILSREPCRIVLVGDPRADDTRALAATVHGTFYPNKVLLYRGSYLAQHDPTITEMTQREGRATAYVCKGHSCQAPVNTPQELAVLLRIPSSKV